MYDVEVELPTAGAPVDLLSFPVNQSVSLVTGLTFHEYFWWFMRAVVFRMMIENLLFCLKMGFM